MTKGEVQQEKIKLLRSAIVDEYGQLAVELAPHKQKQSRFDELALGFVNK
jgi:hypothetical protein